MAGPITNPKVFISYSWKSAQYKKRVRQLAERLFKDGVKVILDQYEMKPGHDMIYFMENSITESSSVLILCEKSYAEKANRRDGGVGRETHIITPEVYGRHDQQKFIPVIMESPWELPVYLKPIMAIDLTEANEEEGYKDLLCAVYGIDKVEKPYPGSTPEWIREKIEITGKTEAGGSDKKTTLGQTPEWVKEEIKNSKSLQQGTKAAVKSVGDSIVFGSYPYEANGGKKDLEWEVLAVEKDRMLVITRDLIDCIKYNESNVDITWENCSLRRWMNEAFIEKAFRAEERSRIIQITNRNPDNGIYGTKGGKETKDKVFALSIEEAGKYFKDSRSRQVPVTPYAEMRGSYINNYFKVRGRGTGWWWLRSPGNFSYNAANVISFGDVVVHGSNVDRASASVRPALWLNL